MKKKFCFFAAILLIVGYVYSQDNSRDIFLDNYFDYQEYKIESHHFSNFDFYFAYNVLDNKQVFLPRRFCLEKTIRQLSRSAIFREIKYLTANGFCFQG